MLVIKLLAVQVKDLERQLAEAQSGTESSPLSLKEAEDSLGAAENKVAELQAAADATLASARCLQVFCAPRIFGKQPVMPAAILE